MIKREYSFHSALDNETGDFGFNVNTRLQEGGHIFCQNSVDFSHLDVISKSTRRDFYQKRHPKQGCIQLTLLFYQQASDNKNSLFYLVNRCLLRMTLWPFSSMITSFLEIDGNA